MSMNTLRESDDDQAIKQLDRSIVFMSEDLEVKISEENSAAVRDLSNHLIKLIKERDALLEKRKKLLTLSEVKTADNQTDDLMVEAFKRKSFEFMPKSKVEDFVAQALQLQAELFFEG